MGRTCMKVTRMILEETYHMKFDKIDKFLSAILEGADSLL